MNNSSIAEQEDLIKDSLFTLVKKHIPSAQFSDIDEIVLTYVVSILEDLGSEVNKTKVSVFRIVYGLSNRDLRNYFLVLKIYFQR